MSLFTDQPMVCCICGANFLASAGPGNHFNTAVCKRECQLRKDWRRTLSITGHQFDQEAEDVYIKHEMNVFKDRNV